MNENQTKEVAEAILPGIDSMASSLLGYLESGVEIAKEQTPILVEEIITWGIFNGVATASITAVVLGILWGIGIPRFYNWCKEKWDYRDEAFIMTLIASSLASIILFVVFFVATFNATKALLVPRLYLIEYFSNLVN